MVENHDVVYQQFVVTGVVQGVGFRYFTYQKASELGLVGYVRNCADGSVEILAGGDKTQLNKLTEWLNQGGPRSARITRFSVTHVLPQENMTCFRVRH